MIIEMSEEERNWILRVCERAKMLAEMGIPNLPHIISMTDIEKIEVLINKLSEKKCEN
jgi:hypothetical protein